MPITDDQLDDAVARGIITAPQRDAMTALATGARRAGAATERAPAILIAYAAGAACVLLAFGWFLIERWERLGPAGVLVVGLAYALILAWTSVLLRRAEFPLAASFAALLAVGMTPLVTWALMSLGGLWPTSPRDGMGVDTWLWPTRWAVIELATALVALLAWRATRFAPLVLPVAVAAWLAPLHIASAFYARDIEGPMFGWGSLLTGMLLFIAAYRVQRHHYRHAVGDSRNLLSDPAGWIFRVVVVALLAGVAILFNHSALVRHGLALLAGLGAVAAVRLGRRELLTAAAAAFVVYLLYLAFDVFEDFVSFPVVLATLGITVILLAVLVQRRWPRIATRLDDGRRAEPRVPGGYLVPALLAALTLAMLVLEPPRARERIRKQAVENARHAREAREQQQARGVRRGQAPLPERKIPPRGGPPGETPGRARP